MSTAHRPTWDPAQAKDVKGGSRQFSVRDMASHTKLKFRQVGQTSTAEVKKRDLRAELLIAEAEAKNKKRKAEGKTPLPIEGLQMITEKKSGGEDDMVVDSENGESENVGEESNKRRKLLQEALELDKDDDDSDDDGEEKEKEKEKDGESDDDEGGERVKGKKKEESESEEEEDSDDEDDETAELLRELEKIKRERADEKARKEREQQAQDSATREVEVATSNPLMNLAAALGQNPNSSGLNTTVPGTFSVKKRWDDDLIFKNQAMDTRDKPQGQFINDLLRTEFHKKFMGKFIK